LKKELKFIDLFAGLGGFHLSIQKLGHSCVFSSEKKELLAKLYKENYGIIPNRDIQLIEDKDIPEHDILCAGFPCQPFSKAGNQLGLEDEANGSLFNRIVGILKYHKPKYFILENVRNLQEHNDGDTWRYIKNQLGNNLGYTISSKVISPHA
jgi:DNA (cytosine-5)-methyltransferase 1